MALDICISARQRERRLLVDQTMKHFNVFFKIKMRMRLWECTTELYNYESVIRLPSKNPNCDKNYNCVLLHTTFYTSSAKKSLYIDRMHKLTFTCVGPKIGAIFNFLDFRTRSMK